MQLYASIDVIQQKAAYSNSYEKRDENGIQIFIS